MFLYIPFVFFAHDRNRPEYPAIRPPPPSTNVPPPPTHIPTPPRIVNLELVDLKPPSIPMTPFESQTRSMRPPEDNFKEVQFGSNIAPIQPNVEQVGASMGWKDLKKKMPGMMETLRAGGAFAETNVDTSIISENHGYDANRYEICFIFHYDEKTKGYTEEARAVVQALIESGGQIYEYLDATGTMIFVLVRWTQWKLTTFADLVDYNMLLDEEQLEWLCEKGDPENNIVPIPIKDMHNPQISKYRPCQHIYCKYEQESPKLYYKPDDMKHAFTEFHRLKVIDILLRTPQDMGGTGLDVGKLKMAGILIDDFPLPNDELRDTLMQKWLFCCQLPHVQPYKEIRDYFGEKIAVFCSFNGYVGLWLAVPGIIGLGLECVVVATQNFSHPVIPFFALVVAVWCIMLTEFWKRRSCIVSMKNGMIEFEETEIVRPSFRGVERLSLTDGTPQLYFPPAASHGILTGTFMLIAVLALACLGVIIAIYYMRYVLYAKIGPNAQLVASVVNAISILLLGLAFDATAKALTELENQRTDTDYEDSLIIKLFLFLFVNNYSSFYYLAFIASQFPAPPGVYATDESVGQCGYRDCMEALAVNLGIIFALRIFLTNFFLWVLPAIGICTRRSQMNAKASNKPLSQAEQEYIKEPLIALDMLCYWYSDSAAFFGYSVLFTSALPAAFAFAFVDKWLAVRLDAYQLLKQYRRPLPKGCEDIGSWQTVFEILSTIGVVTNAALIVFTMKVLILPGWTSYGRMWIFIGFQWVLFLIQFIISVAVPDVPEVVTIQQVSYTKCCCPETF